MIIIFKDLKRHHATAIAHKMGSLAKRMTSK
jgi:hypothetical protein